MASLSSYFINDLNNIVANKNSIIVGKKFRFTVLTERLIRLEYNEQGVFEDRATSLVVNRNFSQVEYFVTHSETLMEVKTKYFTLIYDKDKPFKSSKLSVGGNIKVQLNGTDKEWYFEHPEVRNYGGINFSLDDFKGNLKLDKGLYSTDGFVVINDSDSFVLNNDVFIPRESKEIDLYLFMYKKDLGLCLRDYYSLTGYPSMIPRYALGNWWYKNEEYNEVEIANTVNKFKDNKIPISVFMLGNKWHDNINNFNFNKINPVNLSNYLHKEKIKLGVTIEPSLSITNQSYLYNELSKSMNLNNANFSFLPLDFNKLGIYFNYIVRPLEQTGIDIFNIDYFNKKDLNNLWLLNHYHYTNSAMNKRGLIISRNSKIAPHRYPVIFTGKTNVDWNTLSILPLYNLSASNIGVSWVSHPIGGYCNGVEDDELFMRYVQFGTFSPIFVLASEGGKYYKREPWKWDSLKLSVIREYMQLRNRLIPYIYTEGYNYSTSGSPLIQPLYYEYPKIYDETLYKSEYKFGSQMFVAPITKKKNDVIDRVVQRFFVPSGIWYDFLSGKKYIGDKYYMNFYKDEEYPVFCKAGSIIPLSNDLNTEIPKNLEIQVFPGSSNEYIMYEDDGITHNYKYKKYLKTKMSYFYQNNKFNLSISPLEGNSSFVDNNFRNFRIVFRNINVIEKLDVKVNNANINYNVYKEKNNLVIEIKEISMTSNINILCEGNNLFVEASRLINDDIQGILNDLEISTLLKEKLDSILFSDLPIKKKRIEIRKLKKQKLEEKFIKMFISLLEYINQV